MTFVFYYFLNKIYIFSQSQNLLYLYTKNPKTFLYIIKICKKYKDFKSSYIIS